MTPHPLRILVENEAGALSRISGLFSARGYNIESLTVAPTGGRDDVADDDRHHRLRRRHRADHRKQLNKLVEVVKVVDLTDGNHIERELMLVKVRAAGKDRDEMKRLADIFRGRMLDVTDKSYTIELTGTGEKLDAFLRRDRARRDPRDRAHRRVGDRPRRTHPARFERSQSRRGSR